MSRPRDTTKMLRIGLLLLLLGGALQVGIDMAAAQATEEDEEDEEPTIEIDFDGIEDAIDDLADDFDDLSDGFEEFADNWTEDLADVLKQVIFEPFAELAKVLVDTLTYVMTSYPQVQGNSDVTSLNNLSFQIAVAAGGLVLAAAGILTMTGPVFGIGYAQVRTLFPRIVVALAFGAVSPQLLQYAVDLSEAATYAFQPANPSFLASIRLTGEIALVGVLNSMLLLGLVMVFIIRDFYIMFAVAVAPLLALGWSFPGAKKYADSMIGTFWAALLIGPIDMVLFRFTLSLIETDGGQAPEWLLAAGGILMMIWMPYQIYGASQAAGSGFRHMVRRGRTKIREKSIEKTDSNRRNTTNQRRQSGKAARNDGDYLWGSDDD